MAMIRIGTAFNLDLEFEIAPFHRRLLAYFIDFAILIAYLYTMKYVLYSLFGTSLKENIGLDILAVSLPMLLYPLIMEMVMNGQTIGKKLMNMRVISIDGAEPTPGQYVLRWITRLFEWPFLFGYVFFSAEALYAYIIITGFLGIGALIIITVTPKSQRLGDLAAGTVVVNTSSDMTINDTVFMDIQTTSYQVLYPEVMRLTDSDINTIKSVLSQAKKRKNDDISIRVQYRITDVLGITTNLPPQQFLEKLLEDYNYLATKE